ncbi:hypothetical protein Trydic_g12542 [Trypoxylus dichotomus]
MIIPLAVESVDLNSYTNSTSSSEGLFCSAMRQSDEPHTDPVFIAGQKTDRKKSELTGARSIEETLEHHVLHYVDDFIGNEFTFIYDDAR